MVATLVRPYQSTPAIQYFESRSLVRHQFPNSFVHPRGGSNSLPRPNEARDRQTVVPSNISGRFTPPIHTSLPGLRSISLVIPAYPGSRQHHLLLDIFRVVMDRRPNTNIYLKPSIGSVRSMSDAQVERLHRSRTVAPGSLPSARSHASFGRNPSRRKRTPVSAPRHGNILQLRAFARPVSCVVLFNNTNSIESAYNSHRRMARPASWDMQ
jgi:hypothetical protein